MSCGVPGLFLCRCLDSKHRSARLSVASVESRGVSVLGGVQSLELPFSKVPAKNSNYFCNCAIPPVIHFALLVEFGNNARPEFNLV